MDNCFSSSFYFNTIINIGDSASYSSFQCRKCYELCQGNDLFNIISIGVGFLLLSLGFLGGLWGFF